MSADGKKLSGAAYRRAKKEREAQERAEAAARGDRTRPPAPPLAGPTRMHTWASLLLAEQLREIYEDPLLHPKERYRLLNETARALGLLQPKVDKELEAAEMGERITRLEQQTGWKP